MIYLLFDVDGTLIHSGGAGARALERVFRDRFGIEKAMKNIVPHGKTDPVIVEEIFKKKLGINPSPKEIKEVLDLYLVYLEEEVEKSSGYRVIEGVRESLEELRKDNIFLLGLATGNIERGAYIKLKRGRLNEFFKFGGFGSDSPSRPEILRIARDRGIKVSGKEPEEVFVIGDTPLDVEAAKACRFKSIALTTSIYKKEDLLEKSPDFIFENMKEMLEFLRNLRN